MKRRADILTPADEISLTANARNPASAVHRLRPWDTSIARPCASSVFYYVSVGLAIHLIKVHMAAAFNIIQAPAFLGLGFSSWIKLCSRHLSYLFGSFGLAFACSQLNLCRLRRWTPFFCNQLLHIWTMILLWGLIWISAPRQFCTDWVSAPRVAI